MHDMKRLEERWAKYQAKKRKPWYAGLVSLATLVLILFFITNKNVIKRNFFENLFSFRSDSSQKHVAAPEVNDKSIVLTNGPLRRIEVEHPDSIKLSDATKSTHASSVESADTLVDIPILDQDGNTIDDKDMHREHKSKVHLNIIETTSVSAYEDVKRRFLQSHDIDDALFLAKSYYKAGEYKKAEHWAFEVNKIDSSMEESVFIFVKSKMKLGHKNEAIAILKQYLKRNESEDARKLLENIINNKF